MPKNTFNNYYKKYLRDWPYALWVPVAWGAMPTIISIGFASIDTAPTIALGLMSLPITVPLSMVGIPVGIAVGIIGGVTWPALATIPAYNEYKNRKKHEKNLEKEEEKRQEMIKTTVQPKSSTSITQLATAPQKAAVVLTKLDIISADNNSVASSVPSSVPSSNKL